VPDELLQAVVALAQATYTARMSQSPLAVEVNEVLAQLAELSSPFNHLASFLQTVGAGKPVPAIPAGLPPEMQQLLTALAEAIKTA
jgi:hypothetical protein